MRPIEPDLGWNKKRALLFLVVVLILVIGALAYLVKNQPQVKGEKTFSPPVGDSFDRESREISEGIQEKISDVKQDIRNLDVTEVATSSPQIQKIIKDIESIQDLPSNKAKDACRKICDGF